MMEKGLFGDDNAHKRIQTLMHSISSRFSEMLQLPGSYADDSIVWMPHCEEEWGLRYSTFFTETALYGAFNKGALNGIEHGVSNPNSLAPVTGNPKYAGDDHPAISASDLV
jgi:hypothetical protein